ncbi:hypothetical protein NQ318_008942 [Aromia moschata]|uniref:Uncharacterized protein n=1 Tax=Aromia moschata TaxID=1265417 RepID=A0AAV8ZCH6_9CUCU|nr:hypothetical protein NQ318_008942 [Aromia moschata]
MRIYKYDGSYTENPSDTGFGWYFSDVTENEEIRHKETYARRQSSTDNKFMESIDIVEPVKKLVVKKIDVNIKTQPIANVLECKMDIEGMSVKADEPKLVRELRNINLMIPPKEKLASLVNPCNMETKTLLSILYSAKYRTLIKSETSDELFKTVNFRTTNYKHLINEKEASLKEEMCKEIRDYRAANEDNMMSLMMELILADIDCNLEDIVDVNEPSNGCDCSQSVIETDSGNSMQSSCGKGRNTDKRVSLQGSDRRNILSSIGLSTEDRSIQSFSEETIGMHSFLAEIKESFQASTSPFCSFKMSKEEGTVNELLKSAVALRKELRETLYLDDILHLLKGDIEKVKYKKLPFRVFHKEKGEDCELNLII